MTMVLRMIDNYNCELNDDDDNNDDLTYNCVLTTLGLPKELQDPRSQVLAKRHTVRFCNFLDEPDDPQQCDELQPCTGDGDCPGNKKCCSGGICQQSSCQPPGDMFKYFQ